MIKQGLDWLEGHLGVVALSVVLWVVFLGLTAVAIRYYLILIPPDYFARKHTSFDFLKMAHPVLRWTLFILKNVLGVVLAIAGLLMLFTPGPGWFALLVGLALVDIPGKQAAERWILRKPTIRKLVNRVRQRAGRPPLVFED